MTLSWGDDPHALGAPFPAAPLTPAVWLGTPAFPKASRKTGD